MNRRLPFRYLEPTFFAGLLDDPLLLVNIRPLGRALLFDCGQLHHLAKRVLRAITTIFISHAHMDHFMGMDTFIRHNHVSPRTIHVFGPPGIAARMDAKLHSYDWNLSEPYWCTFHVHEIHAGEKRTVIFSGADSFRGDPQEVEILGPEAIYENEWLRVNALLCDHKIPSLAFRVTERQSFVIDEEKVAAAGLVKEHWLRALKKSFYGRSSGMTMPLQVLRRGDDGSVKHSEVDDLAALYAQIRKEQQVSSIGYVTDLGFTDENVRKLEGFLKGVTLLVSECSFLAADRDKARASHHLCTSDLLHLIERIQPRFVLPMHLSKAYLGSSRLLYEELQAPAGVTVLKVPDHVTPRPLIPAEVAKPEWLTNR